MQFKSSCRPANLQSILLMALAVNACCHSSVKTLPKSSIILETHIPMKRVNDARLLNGSPWSDVWPSWSGRNSLGLGPTPSEVANALSVAKQASVNVVIAQQQLQTAKENVLNQQRIATEKQTQAVIMKQKFQAAASLQRSEAIQQRLAASKAAVAQAAAHAAAIEIQNTEHEAAKLSHFTRNAQPSAGHHISSLPPTKNHLPISYFEPINFGSWVDNQAHFV
ncbi:uncharacterized protein LOC119562290 [Drosophila subpulchrella]|uniref:uncharacterized protein LOC119562290 n=1 Tax=Drosophila subpulchrella TaxID=1486046 RepID=UPI0018A135EF|nr:uncharacterized protein LOC119562290 [Drosophila subpulchrella]